MGSTTSNLTITPDINYNGQVDNTIPHGKGVLTVYDSCGEGQGQGDGKDRRKVWEIQGEFQNGELVRGKANGADRCYEGHIRKGSFSGVGRVEGGGVVCWGEFEDGVLVNGEFVKNGQYSCKGSYVQLQPSTSSHNQKNLPQPQPNLLLLHGANTEFTMTKTNQKLSGTFLNGQLSGKGLYRFQNQDEYNGNFEEGYFELNGIYTSNSSAVRSISGHFHRSVPHTVKNCGDVHLVEFANGDRYEGQFKNGKMHGAHVKYTYSNGRVYKGSIYKNAMTGDCVIEYEDNSPISSYKGQILDGMLNGIGTLTYKSGPILRAYFTKNKKNGPCTYTNKSRSWKCLYIMDELMGDMVQIDNKC